VLVEELDASDVHLLRRRADATLQREVEQEATHIALVELSRRPHVVRKELRAHATYRSLVEGA
jgi:hypothetical protein